MYQQLQQLRGTDSVLYKTMGIPGLFHRPPYSRAPPPLNAVSGMFVLGDSPRGEGQEKTPCSSRPMRFLDFARAQFSTGIFQRRLIFENPLRSG